MANETGLQKTDFEVRATLPDAAEPNWSVTLVDANANCELFFGSGVSLQNAMVDLILGMAVELEARARALGDDYVDVVDR